MFPHRMSLLELLMNCSRVITTAHKFDVLQTSRAVEEGVFFSSGVAGNSC